MINFKISSLSDDLAGAVQHKINLKTKPIGSLGLLEKVGLQLCLIQENLSPSIEKPNVLVFAGDHGIAATGLVNPYPQEVTAQMVMNYVHGGAAINVFCRQNSIELRVIDSGVNFNFDPALPIIHAKVRPGTSNYLHEPAMTLQDCENAIDRGSNVVKEIQQTGCNCLGIGEMGIGNTSSASLLMSALLKIPVADCVGFGTGLQTEKLQVKITTLEEVFEKHQKYLSDPWEIVRHFGGFEIAMMVGAYLKAAELRMIIMVDGFISTAALLVAQALYPAVVEYCIFSHCSSEHGHRSMLNILGAQPLLHLGLRLGEGTGAALAIPLLQSCAAFINEMSSFESAGVSNKHEK